MAKCIVTGGAGFVGSNLVDALVKAEHEVIIIDNLVTGKKEYLNPRAKFCQQDICSPEIEKILSTEKPDYVFHLAAQIDVRLSVSDPTYDNKVNVLGSLNLLECCRKNQVKKIIFISTGGAVYGDAEIIPTPENFLPQPISPYGIHKLAFEKYLNYYHKVFGQNYLTLRPANIYGPRQFKGGEAGVIAIFTDNAINGRKSLLSGDGKQTRDFVFVGDVVKAFLSAMDADFKGEINIATEKETSLLDIISAIEAATGKKFNYEHGPARAGEQLRSCLTIGRAKEILGWEPEVGLMEGIKRTIEWSKNAAEAGKAVKGKN